MTQELMIITSHGVNMKTLREHLVEESGDHRKFCYLPDARENNPFKLGALTSEIFYEQMISAVASHYFGS